MPGNDENAPPPQVLSDTHLTFCLHCGYSLRGLPDGHKCPECGNPSDRESARQEVLDLINQPMLALGWRMLRFWKPLPAGWWWTLDRPEDRREVRRRTWKWILRSGLLMLVLMCSIVMVNRTITIIKYEHPPGEPEKKQVRARGFSSGVKSFVSVTVTPSRTGWIVLTEQTEEVVLDFQSDRMLRMAFFVVGIVLLTWLMMRWVWLPICLATGPRKKSAPELKPIKTIALYQYAPMLTLLLAGICLSWINWALYTLGWIDESRLIVVVAAPLLHVGLIGTTWAAAIRSDRTGQIFKHQLLPILGIILAAGPGGVSATFLIGRLMTSLFP